MLLDEDGPGGRGTLFLQPTHGADAAIVSGAWLEVGIFFWEHHRGMGALLAIICPHRPKVGSLAFRSRFDQLLKEVPEMVEGQGLPTWLRWWSEACGLPVLLILNTSPLFCRISCSSGTQR